MTYENMLQERLRWDYIKIKNHAPNCDKLHMLEEFRYAHIGIALFALGKLGPLRFSLVSTIGKFVMCEGLLGLVWCPL